MTDSIAQSGGNGMASSSSNFSPPPPLISPPESQWPAYFFPPLAQQRMVFCVELLKQQDVQSVGGAAERLLTGLTVCELGCGDGSVLRPMVNGASHSDSFPEPYVEEPRPSQPPTPVDLPEDGDEEQEERNVASTSTSTSRRIRTASGSTEEDDTAIQSKSTSSSLSSLDNVSSNKAPDWGINRAILDAFQKLPPSRSVDKELHLRRIAGLDIVPEHLEHAILATAPSEEEQASFEAAAAVIAARKANKGRQQDETDADDVNAEYSWAPPDRWEDLRVEIWQGSLDVYNEAFDNFEAIIMTEVIEHLYEKQLDKFPEILFGSYRPRIVAITTPNYDFNKYFTRRSTEMAMAHKKKKKNADMDDDAQLDETQTGFLDPTGRTDRVFRDADHKFEWTQQEFAAWCEKITSTYEYSVTITGVGSLKNYYGKGGFRGLSEDTTPAKSATAEQPEWVTTALAECPGGDASKFFATQCAVFKRRYTYEQERNPRSPVQSPLAFYGKLPTSSSNPALANTAPASPGSITRPASRGRSAIAIPGATALSGRGASGSGSGSRGRLSGTTLFGQAPGMAAGSSPASPSSIMTLSSVGNGNSANKSTSAQPTQHKLLKTHVYRASPYAGNPQNLPYINKVVEKLMREKMRMKTVSLRELWGRNEVSRACGGYINKIIQAAIEDGKENRFDMEFKLSLLASGASLEDATFLVLKDFVEEEVKWTGLVDDEDDEDEGNGYTQYEGELSDDDSDDLESLRKEAKKPKRVWPKKLKARPVAAKAADTIAVTQPSSADIEAGASSMTIRASGKQQWSLPTAGLVPDADAVAGWDVIPKDASGKPTHKLENGLLWPMANDASEKADWGPAPAETAEDAALWGSTKISSLMTEEEWQAENPSTSGWD